MVHTALEFFRRNFFVIDFGIAVAAPLSAWLLYRMGRIGRFEWALFWLGFALGLTWEIPMQALNAAGPEWAVHGYVRLPPAPNWVIAIMHSFWDGGLFLIGVGVVRLLRGPAAFTRLSGVELAALIVWGQASELWVELTATFGEAWFYLVKPWNPALFKFNGQDITLMPQLIWLAAPVVFYFGALWLRRKIRDYERKEYSPQRR